MTIPSLFLGAYRQLGASAAFQRLVLPAHHWVTHGVVVGTTGSGKSGLLTVMIEEALSNEIPVLVIDVKGDLPNLFLSFPTFDPSELLPWIEGCIQPGDTRSVEAVVQAVAAERQQGLSAWGITEQQLRAYNDQIELRVITPGATSGELLHMFSSLERRSERWASDPEAARCSLSAAVSLVLRLVGREPDPAKNRDHVLLMVLAERRLAGGLPANLEALLQDIICSPIDKVGALSIDSFIPKTERKALAAALNSLLASPNFANWRQGTSIDLEAWLTPRNGRDSSTTPRRRTPGVIVSVAHLDDEERALVLGVIMEELLTWVRGLSGTQRLRALVVFDEVYGYLPPHPANPPAKRPLVALMKQARAFGVGIVLATQNPMDLDYRALGNAGIWCIGRLQTDADRARVLDGMAGSGNGGYIKSSDLADIVKRLSPRWFLMRDAHAEDGLILLQPRWTMSYMRGPMTRLEIRRARERAGVKAQ